MELRVLNNKLKDGETNEIGNKKIIINGCSYRARFSAGTSQRQCNTATRLGVRRISRRLALRQG